MMNSSAFKPYEFDLQADLWSRRDVHVPVGTELEHCETQLCVIMLQWQCPNWRYFPVLPKLSFAAVHVCVCFAFKSISPTLTAVYTS